MYNFSTKMFLMLYQLTKFNCLIVLILEILVNMCTVTICFPVCNIKNMLIKPFPIWSKKSEQNFKYDQDVMRFLGEVKSICSHF